jgi:hypothetical protein
MTTDESEDRQKVGEGQNHLLANLICLSCQKHCRRSQDDKHLWIEDIYEALIFPDGRFELWTSRDEQKNLHAFMLAEITSITQEQVIRFGQGVTINFYGKRLECSSCGSQEFLPLET